MTHASHEDQLCHTEINCSQGVVTKDSASGSQSDRIYTGTNKNYSDSDEDNDSILEEKDDEQLSDDPEKWLDPHKYGNKKFKESLIVRDINLPDILNRNTLIIHLINR